MRRREIQTLDDHEGGAFRPVRRSAEGADRQKPCRRRAAHQPRMRNDRAGNAGAVNMRAFPAAQRVEAFRDGVRQFGMANIDAGIDHRHPDVGAARQPVRFRQPQFLECVLCRVAFGGRRLLLLQQIAEV